MNQPMTMPSASAMATLTMRLRSSRMCSMSGIRASLAALGARGSRPPEPAGRVGPAGVVMSWARSAGLLRLRLGQRHAVDGYPVGGSGLGLQVIELPLQLLDLLLRLGRLRSRHRGAGQRRSGGG